MKSGTTLIELLIYIALASILATISVELATNLVRARTKSSVQETVAHNLRFVTRRIQHEISQANGVTLFTPTKICLSSTNLSRTPIQIYETSGTIYLGINGTCATSTTTTALSSSDVVVSNLLFSNTSVGSSDHLDYSFDISYSSASSRAEWNYEATATGSSTIR